MKKTILLLIFLLSTVVINAQFQVIGVGATANDATGDPLRTMGIKTNANFSMVQDSFNAALDADDYYWQKTDTAYIHGQVITYDQLMNFQGGGSGVSKDKLQFIIGTTTGAPANGDTILTHTSLIGKEIDFFRGTTADLSKQYFNTTATNGKTGYRFNSTTGTITVRPAFSTGDRCLVEGWNPLNVNWLTFSAGESSLLTGLRAGWQMNESSGTTVNDVKSTYPGTTNATVAQTGKFGYSHSYASASTQMATFGTDVGDLGTSDFSYSAWIYVPTLQSAYNGFIEMQSSLVSFYAMVDGDNYIRTVITFDDTNYINIVSNAAISAATWTNITVTYDRNGNGTLYVNGVAQTDVEDISAHVAVDVQSNINFRIGRGGNSTWYFNGSIDDVYLWTKVLTQDEIDDIQLGTYPW